MLKRLTIGALIGLLVPIAGTFAYCLQEGQVTLAAILHAQLHVALLRFADLVPLAAAYGWKVATEDPETDSSVRSRDLVVAIAAITAIPLLLLAFSFYEGRVVGDCVKHEQAAYSVRVEAQAIAASHGQINDLTRYRLFRMRESVAVLETAQSEAEAPVVAAWSAIDKQELNGQQIDEASASRLVAAARQFELSLSEKIRAVEFQTKLIVAIGSFCLFLFMVRCYRTVRSIRSVEKRIAWQNTELEARNNQLEEQKDELRGREEELSMTADTLSEVNQLLQQASHRFEELFQSLPVACFCFDHDGRIFEWNRASEAQYGLTTEQAFQQTLWEAIGLPEDVGRAQEVIGRVFGGEIIEGVEWTHRRADGSLCNILCSTFPLRGGDGEVVGAISANVDITDLTRVQEHLRDSEERFRSAIHSMQEGLLLIDHDHTVRLSNHAAERIFGTDGTTLVGRTADELDWKFVREDGEDITFDDWPAATTLKTGFAQHEVVIGLEKPGVPLTWLSTNCAPLFRTGEPEPYAVVVTVTDITQRKQYEKKLKEQMVMLNDAHAKLEMQQAELLEANAKLRALATLDGLTGLKNHRSFQERLELEQQRAARYNIPLSLIFLDVDKFKTYNDTYGHPAGDEVLKTVARTLQREARVTDFVARYGGEEFAIILTNTDYAGSLVVSERFRNAIESAPWKERRVTASFGITTLLPTRQSAASLIAEADRALYYSKQNGRNRVTHQNDMPAADSVDAASPLPSLKAA